MAMRGVASGLLVSAVLIAIGSCGGSSQELTELVVIVDTDLDLPSDADRIEVKADNGRGQAFDRGQDMHARDELPVTLSATATTDVSAEVRFTVRAMLKGRTVVERQAVAKFARGQRRAVLVALCRECSARECANGQTCNELATCESPAAVKVVPFSSSLPQPRRCGEAFDAGSPPNEDGGMSRDDAGSPMEDDGGPDSTTTDANTTIPLDPARARIVFLTSQTFGANLDEGAGAIAGADAKCQKAASVSRVSKVATAKFRAWLATSDPQSAPVHRFDHGGSFVRPDNLPIAANWADLTDGRVENQIRIDENGDSVASGFSVWTGVEASGASAANAQVSCGDWRQTTPPQAHVGSATATSANWTKDDTFDSCAADNRLYCFQE